MIEEYDVVSKQVVEQMVKGACTLFGTDYAIASTGYAGRGHDEFPQGLIWIGWGSQDDIHSMRILKNEGKENNTINAAKTALTQFYKYLLQQKKTEHIHDKSLYNNIMQSISTTLKS